MEFAGLPAVAPVYRELEPPADVRNRLLWRDAQRVLAVHQPGIDGVCLSCGQPWECWAHRTARRAVTASQLGAPQRNLVGCR